MKLSRFYFPSSLRTGQNSKQNAGRSNSGRISVRHRGGGHKRLHRHIHYHVSATAGRVVGFFYDPRRSARLAHLFHTNTDSASTTSSFRLATKGMSLFQQMSSTPTAPTETIHPGDVAFLSRFEPGDFVHSVATSAQTKPTIARSAGSFCQVRSVGSGTSSTTSAPAVLRLPSGSHRLVASHSFVASGRVAAIEDFHTPLAKRGSNMKRPNGLGKAGRSR